MAAPLLDKTTCPNCWYQFEPQDILWIAAHADLQSDVRFGADAVGRRFLPSRYTPAGNAIDERGAECTQLACPRCHLPVPRACLELQPWFVSIFGAPSAGKSYFLAAMTWLLRRRMGDFRVSFTDTDATANDAIVGYEEALFNNVKPHAHFQLAELVKKTTEHRGKHHNTVWYGTQEIQYPQPFMFTLQPQAGHPLTADANEASRILCLYDNAGEAFHVGSDSNRNPVTRHLAESAVLLFLFDPLQYSPFRQRLASRGVQIASDLRPSAEVSRQHFIMTEAAGRVRRFAGLSDTQQHDRPLVVIVTKKDVWGSLVPELNTSDPPIAVTKNSPAAINLTRIREQSQAIRRLLCDVTPEVVNAAEAFCTSVTYVGASALGVTPTPDPRTGGWLVRPADIRPDGVELPLLYALHRECPKLIPGGRRPGSGGTGQPPARAPHERTTLG